MHTLGANNLLKTERRLDMNKVILFLVFLLAAGGSAHCQQSSGRPTDTSGARCQYHPFQGDNIPAYWYCAPPVLNPLHSGTNAAATAFSAPAPIRTPVPDVSAIAESPINSSNVSAFNSGANAAAASNASIRGAMANSAIHSWSATAALRPPSDSIAGAASLTDPFATAATCSLTVGSSQTIAADDKVVEYLQQAADSLKSVKSVSDLAEPAALGLAALNATSSAAAGVIPTTLSSIRKLADYLNGERSSLSALSIKSSADWLAASGINSFDRATIPAAQTCLDNFSQRLSTLQGAVQQLISLVQTVQTLLENSEVNSARMVAAGNTLPTGDSMAIWNDVIPALGNIYSQIDTIQSNLSQARSSTY